MDNFKDQLKMEHLNFQECESQMCYCGQNVETTTHFLLHCPNHHCARKTLFYKVNLVNGTISRQSYSTITKILFFGDNKLDSETKFVCTMFSYALFIKNDIINSTCQGSLVKALLKLSYC